MATTSLKADQLQNAFEIFNRQSGMLEESYQQLREKVEKLTGQLKLAQSERLTELVRKERLSRHLEDLLDTLPGAIIVINGAGVIRESNRDATALLNQPLIGCSWAAIVKREVRAADSEDGNIRLKDGRWLSLSRRPLQHESGEVLLLADITESRQMSELRQRQERLTCIGEMTARFSHQVRTPLASAMLYTSQLDPHTPKQQRAVQKIVECLNDIDRMVDDMLGFAAGATQSQESLNVHDLLTEIQVSVDVQLDDQTELQVVVETYSLRVAANRNALKGALLNLVINAVQACGGNGTVILGAHSVDGIVALTVTDNGPGISKDVMPKLFEPFFTTRPQGTGLGLAVVKAVAAAHDGDVSVDSTDNGSRFTIRLPVITERGQAHED